MQEESGCLIVAVRTGRHLDAALDEAVDVLWPKAMTQQVGTRLRGWPRDVIKFRPNSDVPMGVTIEM